MGHLWLYLVSQLVDGACAATTFQLQHPDE